jgi:hypothetical protein
MILNALEREMVNYQCSCSLKGAQTVCERIQLLRIFVKINGLALLTAIGKRKNLDQDGREKRDEYPPTSA